MKNLFTVFGFIFFLYAIFPNSESTEVPNLSAQESAQTLTQEPKVEIKQSAPKKVLYVSGLIVNLRSKATTNSRIISKLSRGTKVFTDGQTNGKWIYINVDSSNVEGWMHGDFLNDVKPKKLATPAPTTKNKRSIAAPTTKEIRDARSAIINQSIRAYPGSCPCPYNRDRAGRKCGGRSAWSRPGGYSPICYASDVTEARLRTYFKRVKGIT